MNNTTHSAAMTVVRTAVLYSTGTLLIMAGLSFDPAASFRYGALMTLLLAGFFLLKSTQPPPSTQQSAAPVTASQQVPAPSDEQSSDESRALEAAYIKGARTAMYGGLALWSISLVLTSMT